MMARWLVPVERTAIFACILPSSLSKSAALRQQRQRADAGEIAAQRVGRVRRRGIDDQLAAGLAAIGADVREGRLEHAAAERGIDRGRREMRLAEIDLGRGNSRLGVDIVQSGEIDQRIAPRRRHRAAAARRHRDIEPLEVEIEFHQRLARQVDRRPAVERAVADAAGEAVDHDHRAVEPHLGLGRKRCLQQVRRIEGEFDRDILPLQRQWRRGRLDLEFERLVAGARAAGDLDLAIAARSWRRR